MWLEALCYFNIVVFKISYIYIYFFSNHFYIKKFMKFHVITTFHVSTSRYIYIYIYINTIAVFSQLSIFYFQQIMQIFM